MSCNAGSLQGLALVAVLAIVITGCDDQIRSVNAPLPTEWGVLLDGTKSSGAVNDLRFISTLENRGVGKMDSGPSSNEEVAGFTDGRPVAFVDNAAWTASDDDEVVLTFANKISLPVTVWIVKGPFDDQRDLAIDHCVTTSGIWNSERMGTGFSQFEIIDKTGDADASTYFDFTCALRTGIQNDIGFKSDRINVYWVDTVDGGTSRGQACAFGSNFVAMGRNANDDLLSHEFGHNFDLEHTNGQLTFDQTNIMHSASSTRQYITEGQLFRKHLDPNSVMNATYAARPGLPTRSCTHGANSNDCPAVNTRIWADGTWPAN